MKRFITITLAVVIIYLLLQNTEVYKQIIKTVTELFGKSFKAVTNVGDFK
jgi:hypothetical protein